MLPFALAAAVTLLNAVLPGISPPREGLSPHGKEALAALVGSGRHPDLLWGNFQDVRDAAMRFYDAREWELAWSRDGRPTSAAGAIVRAVRGADEKGLDASEYDGSRLNERLQRASAAASAGPEGERVELDVAITISVMRYVSDLHFGRVRPRDVGLHIQPKGAIDLAGIVASLVDVASTDVARILATFEPPYAAYERTVVVLAAYRQLQRDVDRAEIPCPQRPLRAGDRYDAAAALARVLELLGDLPTSGRTSAAAAQGVYDESLANAVRRFQRRHGLLADGRLGPDTIAELRVPISHRVAQLTVALERWRWLPHALSLPAIFVNIPEYRLYGISAGGDRFVTGVAVGSAHGQMTPVFSGKLQQVVFRPYWRVPLSIQREVIAPRVARDGEYLDRNGYELVDARGEVLSAPTDHADLAKRLRAGALRVRQRPGPGNALGLVKFVFPNVHDVFLHGTPAQELFSRPHRAVTHGCIRVEDPAGLAAWVLRGDPSWSRERIDAVIRGEPTVEVPLARAMPVLILYGTAHVTADGRVRFFRDVYGHDAALARALAGVHHHRVTAGLRRDEQGFPFGGDHGPAEGGRAPRSRDLGRGPPHACAEGS